MLSDVEPVQNADELLAMRHQATDHRPTIESPIGEGGNHCILNHPLLQRRIEQIRFHRRQVVISSGECTVFALNLSMMLVNRTDIFWPIDDGGKRFKAAFILFLNGDVTPIDLYEHL